MTNKQALVDRIAINSRRGYLFSIMQLSAFFFLLAILSSYFGFTSLITDLSTISDNTFIAQLTFIGFVIAISERIVEAFKRTFRRRTAEEFYFEYEKALKNLETNPSDEQLQIKAKDWRTIGNDYSAETGRMCLALSLSIGCVLASMGVVRVFAGLENPPQFANQYHVMLFDAVDIVITGWVISGGSEGWNNILLNAKGMFSK